MVVKGGETGSKGGAGDVVLDETVDVYDGGGVAELDTGNEYEDEGDHGVDRL